MFTIENLWKHMKITKQVNSLQNTGRPTWNLKGNTIKHNKIKQYVSILHNKDKKDLSNNVKLIYDYLTMKDY